MRARFGPWALIALGLSASCRTTPAVGPQEVVDTIASAERPALIVPRHVLLHQVSIETPSETSVLTGVLGFPTDHTFELHGQTPVGLDVFTLAFDGTHYSAEVAPVLEGRIPGEDMARDIWMIYRDGCDLQHVTRRSESRMTLQCERDGVSMTEVLSSDGLLVEERKVVTESGRTIDVSYRGYERYDGVLHPHQIDLRSGPLSVRIVLTSIALMAVTTSP